MDLCVYIFCLLLLRQIANKNILYLFNRFSDKMSFKIALNNIIDKTNREGIIYGLSYSKSLVAEKIYKKYFRNAYRPNLQELYSVAYVQTKDIDKLFLALRINNFVKENENEFNKVFLNYKKG